MIKDVLCGCAFALMVAGVSPFLGFAFYHYVMWVAKLLEAW